MFISIAMALGYDAIVGGSVIYLGVAVGFAAATINPFTIGIAQEVAGVKMFSGLGYRILCFVVFMGISIWYVWRYARRIQKDRQNLTFTEKRLRRSNVLPVRK